MVPRVEARENVGMLSKGSGSCSPSGDSHVAQFLAVCRRSKWSKHVTNSPFLALLVIVGSNAPCKIGSDVHVMLTKQSRAIVDQQRLLIQWRSTESDDH